MMKFNVAHLLRCPVGASEACDLDAEFVLLEGAEPSRVHGRVQLTKVNRGVWVKALLRTEVPCSCSRCLRDFDFGVRFEMEEIYSQAVDVTTGRHIEPLYDVDVGFEIDQYHVVDITEGIRQSSILALPMKLLCKGDCAGICSHCGTNLNQTQCKCNRSVASFPV